MEDIFFGLGWVKRCCGMCVRENPRVRLIDGERVGEVGGGFCFGGAAFFGDGFPGSQMMNAHGHLVKRGVITITFLPL